jgi:hypothetical protein
MLIGSFSENWFVARYSSGSPKAADCALVINSHLR